MSWRDGSSQQARAEIAVAYVFFPYVLMYVVRNPSVPDWDRDGNLTLPYLIFRDPLPRRATSATSYGSCQCDRLAGEANIYTYRNIWVQLWMSHSSIGRLPICPQSNLKNTSVWEIITCLPEICILTTSLVTDTVTPPPSISRIWESLHSFPDDKINFSTDAGVRRRMQRHRRHTATDNRHLDPAPCVCGGEAGRMNTFK